MSTLHARLLAELDSFDRILVHRVRFNVALRAVVELHKPVEETAYSAGLPVKVWICWHCASLCHSGSGLSCDDPRDGAYPCADIRTIAEALGVSVEGDH